MAWDQAEQQSFSALAPVHQVRAAKRELGQRLLGSTISLSDRAWQEPSRLPGWTRAHVATHIARNADALVRSVDSVLSGRRGLMYDSADDRETAIERGSERTGLDLQIDLDTTIGRLARRLNVLESTPPELMVELVPGCLFRMDLLPVIRLNEIVLHHIDLDCGYEVEDIEPHVAAWLVQWNLLGIEWDRWVSIELRSASGWSHRLGEAGEVEVIEGDDSLLLGWLTGRLDQVRAAGFPPSPAPTCC
ncbi:hypothetical protein HMPREF1531_01960 [Propionibacterium sp. oral taxon 192 str. F0372]|uniref:maleylpyruvate isomerase family mycothiol-dependent enzyme n=1 Tax=Propionibacterium sp. oral taxon 192 TaxID=671222 RepID=UPI0003530E3B|nr:maleylpyruvate isomerase family mycothiol-dependent enzyme [Propionibacterium sp. oral taxon 192]EPH02651.1 hypothetical protein HMPREF1531_01960 [Propionibacterium sp. oral taxon 192 str. F0372]